MQRNWDETREYEFGRSNQFASKFAELMLGLSFHMNFYLCEGAFDIRKGIVGLSELVRLKVKSSPETGAVFIFLDKDRRNLKILRHETNGYVF